MSPARSGSPAHAGSPDRSVRPALVEDATAITRIQLAGIGRVLTAAGAAAPEPGGTGPGAAGPSAEAVREQWRATLAGPPPQGCHTLVALHGHAVAGFASCGPAAEVGPVPGRDRAIPAGTEILALEVDPDFARSGHGSRLLAAMVDIVHPATLRVWVGAGDDARVRFYQSAGFAPAGLRRRLRAGEGTELVEHLWWSELPRV